MAIEHRNALPKGYEFFGYRIEGVLGHGGFGITYKATEIETNRRVAIKEYLPAGFATRDAEDSSVHPVGPDDQEDFEWGLARFGQEAQTLVSFHHPNIVSVHRFFEANNTAYLVMEYERGDSLGAILARDNTLPENEIREFLYPLLDGLSRVHKAGFMHRDIKPENIFIRTDGTPVLLDFGSARQAVGVRSHSLTSIVSSGYAPFEQYTADGDQGPWTDIYALGATLYRAVIGKKPPEATARMSKDSLVAASEAGADDYGPELLGAIDAALVIEEHDRPHDIEAFRAILDGRAPAPDAPTIEAGEPARIKNGEPAGPIEGAPPTPPPAGRPPASMRMIAIVIGATVLVLLAGGGGYYLWQQQQESDRIAEEKRQQDQRRAAEARRRAEAAKRQAAEAERRRQEAARRQKAAQRREAARRREAAQRRAQEERRRARRGGVTSGGDSGGEDGGGTASAGGRARKIVGKTISSLQIRNRCRFGVKALIRIKDPSRDWITVGWIVLAPSRISRAFYTKNRHVYYYGISADGRTVFNKGNLNNPKTTLTWRGRRYTVGHVNMGAKFIRWTVNFC